MNKLPTVNKQQHESDTGSSNLKLIGLKPKQEQKLNILPDLEDVTDGENNDKTKILIVKLAKTTLHLQKAGKLQYAFFRSWGCGAKKNSCLWSLITFGIVALVVFFTLGVVIILTCYFVIIPINRSISDAPNRLVGIYESAIVLVGA